MNRSTFLTLLALALLSLGLANPATLSAEEAQIQATLIMGSNENGGVDGQLQRYERHLKRVFRYDTFKQQGQGSARVAVPGTGSISIGGGNRLSLDVSDAGSDKLRIAAKWTNGGRVLVNTTVVSPRDQPTVLGGPASGGGMLILLLVAR